jgi:hypothetical protein
MKTHYRLRTLLIVLAVGPVVLWIVWAIALVRMTHYPPRIKEYKVPASGGLRITVPLSEPAHVPLHDPRVGAADAGGCDGRRVMAGT